jgi:hypothetical protein
VGRYALVSEWWAEATPDQVWGSLADYRDWPAWWHGIRRVELLDPGPDGSGVGAVLRQHWRARLPFDLVFTLTMVAIERRRRLDGRAAGDLEGEATWTFDEDGGGTRIRFAVDVRTTRWWMNLPVPFAGWLFRTNFETVMSWGSEGLGRSLGVLVEDRTREARTADARRTSS